MKFVYIILGTFIVAASAMFNFLCDVLNLCFITACKYRHSILSCIITATAILAGLVIVK